MPVTSTGEANEAMPFNSIVEYVGREKAAGKIPGLGPGMPAYEKTLPLHTVEEAELHQAYHELAKDMLEALWYSDPKVKWLPITLDPNTENILHYEGRCYSGIYISSPAQMIVQPPGLAQAIIQLVAGWNIMNYPEGTRLYAVSARIPAWIVIANRPLAGSNPVTSVGLIGANNSATVDSGGDLHVLTSQGFATVPAGSQVFPVGTNNVFITSTPAFRGAFVTINITNIATGTLTTHFQMQEAATGNYFDFFVDGTAISANGNYIFVIYPGIITNTSLRAVVPIPTPTTWRVQLVVATAGVTASVGLNVLP